MYSLLIYKSLGGYGKSGFKGKTLYVKRSNGAIGLP